MASIDNEDLNTPNDVTMSAPIETPKKKRGRPRKCDSESPTPRKSARQAEQKQTKKELLVETLKTCNGEIDSDEEWSFDEEDEDYLSSMFKKLHNVPGEDLEEEEDEEEDDEDEEDEDGLFQDDFKDVYDFDQQSSVISKQEPRVTRRWLSQQQKRGQIRACDPQEGSSWGSNIYSHIATLLNTREDLDIYSRFLKCAHVNRNLDSVLADLCKPFRSTLADGLCASLRSLVTTINDPSTVVDLVRDIVSDRFDNAAHRISHFVVVVQQPICGIRFCTGSADSLHFSDILHSIDPKIIGDASFVVEADRTDSRRIVADVDTIVVSDSFHSFICDHLLSPSSTNSNKLHRIVVGLDENKSLFGIFVLDVWNRAGVPYNRPRKFAASSSTPTPHIVTPHCTTVTDTTMEFIDSFFVRMGGKKGVLHLVIKLDSRFLVYNVLSEYSFAFKKHGLSPNTPIVLEGMYSTFPEVLGEEKSVLVVPDQLYRSLSKTLAREVCSPNCRFKKCVLLDKRTRLPLALFFETEVTMDLQIDGKVINEQPLSILSQAVVHSLKPTTQNIMLVSLNGILVGFEVQLPQKSISKCYEVVSDNRAVLRPSIDRRQSVQTTYLSCSEGSSTTLQLANIDNHENTFVSASLYDNVPFCKRQEQIDQYLNDIADRIFDLPLKISLLDSLFRFHQQIRTPIVDPSTVIVPAQCHCVFCGREFRPASLYDHEVRHLGLVKFKCQKHQMVFSDQKTYRGHREEFLDCDGHSDGHNETELETQKLLNISASITDCPQCHKCYDYFPVSDLLAQHIDCCDGVSFSNRTPLDNTGNQNNISTDQIDAINNSNTCGLCGLNYPKMDTLCTHMQTHLTCNVCKSRLGSIEEVSAHIRDHVLRKDVVSGRGIRKIFTCDICNDFYGTKINYYYHQWMEHGVVHPPIKSEDTTAAAAINNANTGAVPSEGANSSAGGANINRRRWKRNDELSYNATGSKKFACKFCSAEVKVSGRTYLKHLDTKHGLTVDSDSICRICADVFETTERLSEHLRARHLKDGLYVNAGVQSIFSCDKCTFFGHFVGVVNHSSTVHCDPSPCLYECPHCPERMLDRRLWRMHLEKHDEINTASTVVNNLQQILVDRKVPIDVDDNNIGLVGTVVEEHQCDICNKSCKTLKAYELHRLKHFRTRIFQCTECQATFRSKLAMRRHIRVDHLNLEPERYECQICGKIVTQISMHMLIHKNARYQCEFCDKRFTKSAYYNEHVRIHRGEKPYECHICQRKFNKKSNLNVHISFHEKHRDDYGNYLEIKPRGRGHPDYDPEKTRARKTAMIKYDAVCGADEPGRCLHDDSRFKMINVGANSKACDTEDLQYFIDMLASAPPAIIG